MIKIAVFGLAHPHAEALYSAFAKHKDEVEFLGFADVPPFDNIPHKELLKHLGKECAENLKEFSDWHELMDLNPDLAIVTTDNRACGDVYCELLSRKIAVLNEKPMTMDYADAKRVAEYSKKYDTPVITNWPVAWLPAFRTAKKLADEGKIGKVMRVVYRSPATWGPFSYAHAPAIEDKSCSWWYRHDRGGGSILDYASYGAILATWFFGRRAERVSAITKNFISSPCDIEDYSAMILDFGDGVGLLEGSWSTFNCGQVPSGPVIYGTEGTIVCDRYSTLVKVYVGGEHTPVEPTEVIDAGAPEFDKMSRNVLDFLKGNGKLDEILDLPINMDVVATLDAGFKSAESGQFADVEKE